MNKSLDLLTFGEVMLRLSPPDHARLEQATSLDLHVGGSELNTAVTCQRLGLRAGFVTRLPRTPLGRIVENKAREHGVDTRSIAWVDDGRVGAYYVEFGASPRPSRVIYDRAHSTISQVQRGDIDWDAVLEGVRCLHTSGITPALSSDAAVEVRTAFDAAKRASVLVSLDLNYRRRLWSGEEACATITPLMEDVDVLLTTEEDAERVFGVTGGDFEDVARELVERFDLGVVGMTVRDNVSVWRNGWTGIAHDGTSAFRGPTFDIEIVDRVGGGDAFTGGFLRGYLADKDVHTALQIAVAASALAQTNPGDVSWATMEEVEQLLAGMSKRIDR
jgi:2-dehydro-3-deoxygluconokinase